MHIYICILCIFLSRTNRRKRGLLSDYIWKRYQSWSNIHTKLEKFHFQCNCCLKRQPLGIAIGHPWRQDTIKWFTLLYNSKVISKQKYAQKGGQGKNMLPIFTPPEAGGGGATKYQKSSYSPWQRFQTIVQRAHKLVQDSVVYRAALGSPVITRLTRQAPLLHIVVDLLEASSELLYTYVSILILVQFQKYFVKVFSGQLFADLGELSFVDISRPV